MPAAKQRRWTAAGRELQRRDPERFGALLELAERLLRIHRKQEKAVRRRFARR